MKAKIYIGIIAAMVLAVIPAKAQFADNRDFRNDEATLVVNNYYDDYDYYFSSRINRFHRSYSAFSYYSPVFTETYWYNYQPWSWGVSIYGRNLFGFGIAYSYPMYNYGWGNTGWFDPYYGYNYSYGYDPFYYNWYSPVVININYRSRYAYNNYGWYGHNRWNNNYRPVYNTYNYYYNTPSTRYSSRDYSPRPSTNANNRTSGSDMRRESVSTVNPRTGGVSNRPVAGNNGNIGTNNGNNRNSVENGNNGNFGNNNRNSGNSGNNNNSLPGGNNGNFGNRDNVNKGSAVTVPVERRVQPTTPGITRNNNAAVNSGNARNSTVNTPSRSQVNSMSAPAPPPASQRRTTVSTGNSQSSGRSAVTPSRSTSSSKSETTVTNTRSGSSGSSSKESGSSSKSSSGSSSESGRRR